MLKSEHSSDHEVVTVLTLDTATAEVQKSPHV